jgi:hypothetical protein
MARADVEALIDETWAELCTNLTAAERCAAERQRLAWHIAAFSGLPPDEAAGAMDPALEPQTAAQTFVMLQELELEFADGVRRYAAAARLALRTMTTYLAAEDQHGSPVHTPRARKMLDEFEVRLSALPA